MVVSTYRKKMSQIGSFSKIGVKIQEIWKPLPSHRLWWFVFTTHLVNRQPTLPQTYPPFRSMSLMAELQGNPMLNKTFFLEGEVH